MGLFGKKDNEKQKCPICGGEMSFFSSALVKDGSICADCARTMRGIYDVEHWTVEREDGSRWMKQYDTLQDATIEEIRQYINATRQEQSEAVTALGQEYSAIFKIEETFVIAPKPLDVGLKRSKLLRDKTVAKGLVQAGTFTRDDSVTLLHGERKIETKLLAVYQCGVSDFDTELGANMCKSAKTNCHAWLILEADGAIPGDTIAKT